MIQAAPVPMPMRFDPVAPVNIQVPNYAQTMLGAAQAARGIMAAREDQQDMAAQTSRAAPYSAPPTTTPSRRTF